MNFKAYQHITEQVNLYNDYHTLGIPRAQMPQIKSHKLESFEEYLQSSGFSIKRDSISVDKLKLTQSDINMNKVVSMTKNINKIKQKYVIISSDNYILDGHHRIFALQMTHPNQKVPVHRVNIKIKELLAIAGRFKGTTKENL